MKTEMIHPQLIDSHCHLPLIKLEGGLEAILKNAQKEGIGHILCVSVDLETWPEINEIANKYDNVYGSVGVHPNTELETEITVKELIQLAENNPGIIAIGETGLDYYRNSDDLAWQKERFIKHIQAARAVNKPLIIHTREAGEDTVRLLRENKADEVSGVMHCFVDDYEIAKKALDLGFYISFSGIVTFKNAKQVQEVAKRVPLDRILVETDSPYLAPVPFRGKTNQPAYVRHVAEFVSNLRGIPMENLIAATTDNFFRLFQHAIP